MTKLSRQSGLSLRQQWSASSCIRFELLRQSQEVFPGKLSAWPSADRNKTFLQEVRSRKQELGGLVSPSLCLRVWVTKGWERSPGGYPASVVSEWPLGKQHQQLVLNTNSQALPHLLNQRLWAWGRKICVLISPIDVSEVDLWDLLLQKFYSLETWELRFMLIHLFSSFILLILTWN